MIACLQDGNAVEYGFGDLYREFKDLALHWVQFSEITARIFYDLSRLTRTPKFILHEGDGRVNVMLLPLGGLSSKPLFSEWQYGDYARFLSHCSRFPVEVLHPNSDGVISWLRDAEGLRQMAPDDPA